MKRIEVDQDTLVDLYYNKGLSLREVAKEMECSMQTISRRMKDWGLETRTSQEGKSTQHYKQKISVVHESMRQRDVRTCKKCKKEFTVQPHKDQKYCSQECYHADRDPALTIPTTCDYCGRVYPRPGNYPESKHTFCSTTCAGKWKSRHNVGHNSPTWSRVQEQCGYCGKTIWIKRSLAENNEKYYCNQECMARDYETRVLGKDNPNWSGGKIRYYGPDWHARRREVRLRDKYTCQRCGVREEELGHELSVHHIKLFRDCESSTEANQPHNLVSLCPSCHSFVHSNSNTEKELLIK